MRSFLNLNLKNTPSKYAYMQATGMVNDHLEGCPHK
ncbi:DNA-3-methyladenine glycosylase I [Vibrio sp. 10N.222.49.A3]